MATVMRRLLTGHAGFYNRRYRRHGNLFQNRYKSILCQADVYLKELGIPMADLSRLLKISLSAISLSVQRGEEICASKDYNVTDLLKL